ncbi:hypothetical protein [Paenibacillus sp. KR2-11]|uniref:hypothetical protein n=1 Tax=Paenibacillus sp. KR2-11 TaxID=3385500 RepID=UPI0038FD3B15
MDDNKANEKLNFLSEDEEIRRVAELREKGRADQIAQFEFLLEKQQLEIAKKMLDKGYGSSEIAEILDVPEQVIQRWCEAEMDSLDVIQSVSTEGFESGWKAGRKSTTKATIARDRAALMNKVPKNPNKRPCIAKNITFPVQSENEYWIRLLSKKTLKSRNLECRIKNRQEVKAALEKIGYRVKDGVNKDIGHPNCSGIIGKKEHLNSE